MRKIIKFKSLNTVRRKRLIKFIFRKNIEIRFCTNYIKAGKRYITDRNYNKLLQRPRQGTRGSELWAKALASVLISARVCL